MPTITLQGRNPLDPRPEEIEDLAQAIRDLGPDYDVIVAPGERPRTGVSMREVIECHVPWTQVTSAGIAILTPLVTDWLRARFKRAPNRPKSVIIFGPSGEVLKEIEMRTPSDKPADRR